MPRHADRLYSTLAFAGVAAATPLYIVWSALFTAIYQGAAETAGTMPAWTVSLMEISDPLLFFGGVFTYLGTLTLILSLRRSGILGRAAEDIYFVITSLLLLALITRGVSFPQPQIAFARWYTASGFIAGIPATPWIIPCLLGVMLLRRAGQMRNSEP